MIQHFLKTRFTILISFVVLALVVFAPSLRGFFVSDDWDWLAAAHDRLGIIPDFFANSVGTHSGGSYVPITSLVINITYAFAHFNPVPYHVLSILLHAVNAFLIVILCLHLMKFFSVATDHKKALAILSGLFFLVLPVHSEAVSWFASIPHLIVTFFILCSLIFYLNFRSNNKVSYLGWALLAATCALFSKESAVVIPFFILILEVTRMMISRARFRVKIFSPFLAYLVLTILFFALRYYTIGLFMGTYAEQSIVWRPEAWLFNFLTFFEEFVSGALVRSQWASLYWTAISSALIILIPLVALLIYCIRRKKYFILIMGFLACAAMLPFVTLGFSRTTVDGERYTYLSAVFFCIAVAYACMQIKNKYAKIILVALTISLSCIALFLQNTNWQRASVVSRQMMEEFATIAERADAMTNYYLIATPDTFNGAHVFRNNFQEAIHLTNPNNQNQIKQIPVYLELTSENISDKNLVWNPDSRGWFGVSPTQTFVITGKDRVETPDYTFELWGYNYRNFKSPIVRLMLAPTLLAQAISGEARFIVWNNGHLEQLTR